MIKEYEEIEEIIKENYKKTSRKIPFFESIDTGNHSTLTFDKYNEFLIIIKPEVFLSTKYSNILNYIFGQLERYKISISEIYTTNGMFNKLNAIFENEYYVLNKGANYGIEALSKTYKDVVMSLKLDTIYGSYPYLKSSLKQDEKELQIKAHETGVLKIGNGTYLTSIISEDKKIGIINAFHPYQITHFNNDSHFTVFLVCQTLTDYQVIANDLIGYFNPSLAKDKSIRNYLFKNKDSLFFPFDTIYNGIHLSPSTFEATRSISTMRRLSNNTIIKNRSLNLLDRLNKSEISNNFIYYLYTNPEIYYDEGNRVFNDIIEGENNDKILEIIKYIYSKR